jgi:hypothetical protein
MINILYRRPFSFEANDSLSSLNRSVKSDHVNLLHILQIDFEYKKVWERMVRTTIDDLNTSLQTICTWSPYSTEADLLEQVLWSNIYCGCIFLCPSSSPCPLFFTFVLSLLFGSCGFHL